MSGRLLAIEARRNVGPYFLLLILGVTWYVLSLELWVPFLWRSTNEILQKSVVPFAAPAMAGAAAWMAGRDRRRGMTDLLATTAQPATARRLTLLAATAAWGLLAYVVVAAIMLGRTTWTATWGGPELWPVVTVAAALVAHAGWGFLAGQLVPSRFTAPFVGIAAFGLQQLAAGSMVRINDSGYAQSWISSFAAHNGAHPVAQWQAMFYVSLAAAAIAAIAVASVRSPVRWAALAGTSAIVIASVVMVWGEYPRWSPGFEKQRNGWGQTIGAPDWTPPPTVCEGEPVSVCASQEYQPILAGGIEQANRLAEPLLGLPGVPLQVSSDDTGMSVNRDSGAQLEIGRFATRLVADTTTLNQGEIANEPQHAIRIWLLDASGVTAYPNCADVPFGHDWPGVPTAAACDAAARFSSLPVGEQRAWLEANYTRLRAGTLTLADLP